LRQFGADPFESLAHQQDFLVPIASPRRPAFSVPQFQLLMVTPSGYSYIA
jgi:hypothetical protein